MSIIKICIDAGHFGKYNKSNVVPEYYESDFTWKFHLMLKKCLEDYGIEVVTTRNNKDNDLGLHARGAVAKGCDLFLSIHSNWAERASADFPLVIVPINGSADDIGKKLGNCIRECMSTNEPADVINRKADDGYDWYGVIRGAASVGVPGVILEHSFHSNERATKWLLNDANLERMAQSEADVIASYYGVAKPAPKNEFISLYVIQASKCADNKEDADKSLNMLYEGGYDVAMVEKKIPVPTPSSERNDESEVEFPTLNNGDEGDSVKAMQSLLIGYGYKMTSTDGKTQYSADGLFGGATERALKAYQSDNGLSVDGCCGERTWCKLLGIR